jgi:hypothetical protein
MGIRGKSRKTETVFLWVGSLVAVLAWSAGAWMCFKVGIIYMDTPLGTPLKPEHQTSNEIGIWLCRGGIVIGLGVILRLLFRIFRSENAGPNPKH